MSDTTIDDAYMHVAPGLVSTQPTFVPQPEAFTELPVWDPFLSADSLWERLPDEELVTVINDWLRSKAFSRKKRREHERLNLPTRTGEVVAGLPLPQPRRPRRWW